MRVGLFDGVHFGRQLRGLHLRVGVKELFGQRWRRLAERSLTLLLRALLLLHVWIDIIEAGERLWRRGIDNEVSRLS